MSQANIELIQNCYAAFQRGDIAAVCAALTEDVQWVTPGEGIPTEGVRHGVPSVMEFFQSVGSTWEFTNFEPREYVAMGDTVIAIGSYSAIARATGRAASSEWVMVWKIRDGKVWYFREYTDTLAMACALQASA